MSRASWRSLASVLIFCSFGCSSQAGDDRSGGAVGPGGSTAGGAGGAAAGGSNAGGVTSSAGAGGSPIAGAGGTTASAGSGGTAGSGGSTAACVPMPLTGASSAKLLTVGYLPTYRGAFSTLAQQVDFAKLSYVNISFAEVDASGTLSLVDTGLCPFVNAAHAAGVKVCAAIGGATTIDGNGGMGKYLPLLAPEGRAAFIEKIDSFLDAHNLDCIDLDFENPNLGTDYGGFVASLSSTLKAENKEVTTAVGRWFGNAGLTAALPSFDLVNVMAYDMCEFWESTPCAHSEVEESQNEEMAYWAGQGVPASKLVLGVPFYGYRWQGGVGQAVTYAEIVSTYGAAAENDWIESGGATIVHNSIATIKAKAALAKASYGGIMIWEIMQDAPAPASLLDAIDSAL